MYGFDMIVPFCCSELGGIFFGEIFAVITNFSFIAVRGLVSGKISPLTRLHLMLDWSAISCDLLEGV